MADIAPQEEGRLVVELGDEQPAGGAPIGAVSAPDAEDEGIVEIADEEAEDDGIPARAKRNADGTITLPLLHPVTLSFRKGSDQVRHETITELTMRRLTGKDLRVVSAAKHDASIVAVARSAQIPEVKFNAIFDRMDGEDASAAIAIAGNFLGAGQKTGR